MKAFQQFISIVVKFVNIDPPTVWPTIPTHVLTVN